MLADISNVDAIYIVCGRTDMLNGFILIMAFNYVEMLNRVYLINNFKLCLIKDQ